VAGVNGWIVKAFDPDCGEALYAPAPQYLLRIQEFESRAAANCRQHNFLGDFKMSKLKIKMNNQNIFYLFPGVMGLIAACLVSWLSGASVVISLVVAVVLAVNGVVVGAYLFKKLQADLASQAEIEKERSDALYERTESYVSVFEQLFIDVIPIISNQIDMSKKHTEQEILTLSEKFSEMAAQIGTLVSGQANDDGHLIENLLEGTEEILNGVVGQLSAINEAGQVMIEEMRQLSSQSAQLDGMAQEVREVAGDIHLLSLNAAIEAARAGEQGSGFAVVASEVRNLAKTSSETGSRISETVESINAAMDSALNTAEITSNSDKERIHLSETYIAKVLGDIESTLTSFKNNTDALTENNAQIQTDIYSVMTALQFQDRVSQMLDHATHNLSDLSAVAEKNKAISLAERSPESIQVSELMEKMEQRYTMPDELLQHKATVSGEAVVVDDAEIEEEELTFF